MLYFYLFCIMRCERIKRVKKFGLFFRIKITYKYWRIFCNPLWQLVKQGDTLYQSEKLPVTAVSCKISCPDFNRFVFTAYDSCMKIPYNNLLIIV